MTLTVAVVVNEQAGFNLAVELLGRIDDPGITTRHYVRRNEVVNTPRSTYATVTCSPNR